MNNFTGRAKSVDWLSFLTTAICTALLLMAAQATAQSSGEAGTIVVSPSPSIVTFAGGTDKAAGRLKVRIDGPNGETVYESVSEAGLLDWVPESGLPDGQYRWDAWFAPQSALNKRRGEAATRSGSKPGRDYRSGSFQLEGGALIIPDEGMGGEQASLSWPERALGTLLNAVVPPAAAQHSDAATISDDAGDNGTFLSMDNIGNDSAGICNEDGNLEFYVNGVCLGGNQEMILESDTGYLGLGIDNPDVPLHMGDSVPRLRFEDTDDNTAWTISASSDEFRLQDNAGGSRPFIVDAGTDSEGAPVNSLYIESPTGDIGMGTSTPQSPLHIVDPGGFQVRLEANGSTHVIDSFSGNFSIGTPSLAGQFRMSETAPNSSLVVDGDGKIGIGTFGPDEPLHVRRTNGTAQVLVEDTNEGNITMFRLSNNGHPRFRFQNTSGTETKNWEFRTAGDGANEQFQINRITPSEGSSRLMRVLKNGDTEFEGDVTANGILLTSSRETKTDFSQVDEHTVLEKVAALDVSQWRYKREPDTERHIGPMAEDFQAVFGLGDGEHISAGDANGILFAAAKALKAETSQLEAETSQLEAENRSLRNENRELRDRLERIESRLGISEQ